MQSFDYVIVGAGSAGCVLARRLSEDPSVKVALLEAGGSDKRFLVQTPAAYSQLHYSKFDWAFKTVPQPGVANREMHQPRGKVLGGCSSTNCMAYIRGHRSDYDHWADLGNRGWSYGELLPYFRKSEHNEQFDNQWHGKGGPLNVTKSKDFITPLGEAFVQAHTELGYPANDDFNGAQQEGAGLFQFTIRDGKRCNTVSAFLKEARKRPNLHIISHAFVQQILLDGKQATGVEFMHKGRNLKRIQASREVILAAGAFGSPQLLMVSGIGPADHLQAVGAPLVHDLPGVGQNLQDHLIVGLSALTDQPVSFNTKETAGNLFRYLLFRKGPFSASPLEACSFIKTDSTLDAPDMQLHFAPAHGDDIHDSDSFPRNQDGYSILPTLIRPQSVGELRLQGASAQLPPLIDPRYFSAQADLDVMLKGVKIALELFQTQAFAPFHKEISYPSGYQEEEQLIQHIMEKVETCYHPVGTCKMGHDPMAVVDEQLRVRGIAGLRVVDASIMPRIPAGNTNAPTIMIAEKAADMIRGMAPVAEAMHPQELEMG